MLPKAAERQRAQTIRLDRTHPLSSQEKYTNHLESSSSLVLMKNDQKKCSHYLVGIIFKLLNTFAIKSALKLPCHASSSYYAFPTNRSTRPNNTLLSLPNLLFPA